jgi:hypothetical protein
VNVINKLSSRGVIANPSLFVILSPSPSVILSEAKNLFFRLRTGSAKNLIILLRVNSVKPCPEQSEGTLEIATGFALATTFLVGLPRLRAEALQRAGTSLHSLQ